MSNNNGSPINAKDNNRQSGGTKAKGCEKPGGKRFKAIEASRVLNGRPLPHPQPTAHLPRPHAPPALKLCNCCVREQNATKSRRRPTVVRVSDTTRRHSAQTKKKYARGISDK